MAYGFHFGFHPTSWVKRLIIANVAAFLLVWLLPIEGYVELVPSESLFRPWTLLSYMFVHAGFWHLFFNLLMLFFFGPPLEERWGSREFIKFYLLCGLGAAALAFVFAYNGAVVGASGAIYGVMVAFAILYPDSPIYIWGVFPVPAKWLVAALVFFAFMMSVGGGGDGIAHFAHLGGAVTAFLYLKLSDRVAWKFSELRRTARKPRLSVSGSRAKPSAAPTPPRPRRSQDEERVLDEVDRVLDKISASGIASLTPEERKVLDEVSRRYRRD